MKIIIILMCAVLSLPLFGEDDHFVPQKAKENIDENPGWMPIPSLSTLNDQTGTKIYISSIKNVRAPSPWIQNAAEKMLKEQGETKVKTKTKETVLNCVIDREIKHKEGYKITFTPEVIEIRAQTEVGLYWGIQTLRQCRYVYPGILEDAPKYEIRGLMHDVGRNYQNVDLLKKQIDMMSRYKYNIFHFHVTDNPAWRMESKRYPQVNAPESMTRQKGKFYTQEEYKDLVAYAKERAITIIPEIDIPGHTAAFRRAFKLSKMNEPQVQTIIADLLNEFMDLVPEADMPYIHLGTDEAKGNEGVPAEWLEQWTDLARKRGKQVITWNPGIKYGSDHGKIQQMWTGFAKAWPNRPYIYSRNTYINHIDMFELLPALVYRKIEIFPKNKCLGAILCVWHDDKINKEMDVIRMNGVYPAMIMFSNIAWNGEYKGTLPLDYIANIPSSEYGTQNLDAQTLDVTLQKHRDYFFAKESFPYVSQMQIPWRIIHFPKNDGKGSKDRPSPENIKLSYENGAQTWEPYTYYGATIYPEHFWYPGIFKGKIKDGEIYAFTRIYSPIRQDVGAWIGFHAWSRSFGQRRGGPQPKLGEWSISGANVWVNGKAIPPPQWGTPGAVVKDEETPLIDQDYHYRTPSALTLEKGWNTILIKCPKSPRLWKWVFTFTPVIAGEDFNAREVPGLKYSAEFETPEIEQAYQAYAQSRNSQQTALQTNNSVSYNFDDAPEGPMTQYNTPFGRFSTSFSQNIQIQNKALNIQYRDDQELSFVIDFSDVEPLKTLEMDVKMLEKQDDKGFTMTCQILQDGEWKNVAIEKSPAGEKTRVIMKMNAEAVKAIRFSFSKASKGKIQIDNLKLDK